MVDCTHWCIQETATAADVSLADDLNHEHGFTILLVWVMHFREKEGGWRENTRKAKGRVANFCIQTAGPCHKGLESLGVKSTVELRAGS
eukprot:1160144-Pelagomonas_calceolata.AAC.6